MSPAQPDRVLIFDTTLRDGEQSPGISLNKQEKLEIAHQLARLGVDIIEAGFPIASPGDFEAVQAIAREVHGPIVAGLARANPADVERAWEAVRDAERPRIHTFVSTSDIHIVHQLQATREDVKGLARASVAQAKSYCEDVEFSPMDATRADLDFTAEVLQIALDERAGNASLEEIVMLLHTRAADVGLTTGVNTREIARTSRLVSRLTGYPVQPNKAIVGRNAFAHEAGIHQDGVLKDRTTYEIMDAQTIGLQTNQLVLGKHSGRHALRNALEELGVRVDGQALNTAFKRFKEIADKKKNVTALDLEAIVSDEIREQAEAYNLASFEVRDSSSSAPVAKVEVTTPDGRTVSGEGTGDGAVDALLKAINAATGKAGVLKEYHVEAGTPDTDALGEVSVLVEYEGRLVSGQGVSTDTLEASGRAYLRALSNALAGMSGAASS